MKRDGELGEYLDVMISELYVQRKFSGYTEFTVPLHSEVVEYYIEGERTGRPHPIDDSADHFLLMQFDIANRYLQTIAIPKGNGKFGFAIMSDGSVNEANELCGEVPWRNKHVENCTTCGRSTDEDAFICSNPCHLNILTHMMEDRPGVYRPEITRTLPLRKADE